MKRKCSITTNSGHYQISKKILPNHHQITYLPFYNFSGHENVTKIVAEFLSERLRTPNALDPRNLNFQTGNSSLLPLLHIDFTNLKFLTSVIFSS